MKPQADLLRIWRGIVAPRAGAWIETSRITRISQSVRVAPRAGAWIETAQVVI